ncbi:MAG: hypothetical protein CR986_03160 [Ignavibacteriae bacterium]|nr:MAG: hypothetical protein CR986_03160 [Ignavibacteriota bacterium]
MDISNDIIPNSNKNLLNLLGVIFLFVIIFQIFLGSGKSTILNILQNIYPIKDSSIHIGEINLNNIYTKSLKNKVVGIPQQIDLFKVSLLENIALGNYEPDINRITFLTQNFGFTEFINNLSNGLETYVEEKGSNFSGGEKQKIAILRTFYRKPKVVLLDETTSAMDNISETKVFQGTYHGR